MKSDTAERAYTAQVGADIGCLRYALYPITGNFRAIGSRTYPKSKCIHLLKKIPCLKAGIACQRMLTSVRRSFRAAFYEYFRELIDAVNSQVDDLIESQVLQARGSQSLDVFWGNAVNAQRNELLRRHVRITQVTNLARELR
jgi:hypothetical protein